MQKFRQKINLALTYFLWRVLRVVLGPSKRDPDSLVIIPCDPGSPIGSRGDEAMIYSVLQHFIKLHPSGVITVVCSSLEYSSSSDGQRLKKDFPCIQFVGAWHGHFFLKRVCSAIRKAHAGEVVVIGADCMDGFYSPLTSLALLAIADISISMSVKARITGFSFNDKPSTIVVKAFRRCKSRVNFNLRDAVSLERFKRRIGCGELVADTAFCLEPDFSARITDILDKMKAERGSGKIVLGINMNPLLDLRIDQVNRALGMLKDVSVWRIPHDFREGGDLDVLSRLGYGHLVASSLSAAELKALMSGLDALWTSRMHLGIAALGMGKPIGAFAYQGKFDGLYRHFGLNEKFLLDPLRVDEFTDRLASFLEGRAVEEIKVREALPRVRELAGLNL